MKREGRINYLFNKKREAAKKSSAARMRRGGGFKAVDR